MQAIDTRIEQLATAASCLGLGSGLWAIVALHLLPIHLNTTNTILRRPSERIVPPPLEHRRTDPQATSPGDGGKLRMEPAHLVCEPGATPHVDLKRPSGVRVQPSLKPSGQGGQLRATASKPTAQHVHTIHFDVAQAEIGFRQSRQLAAFARRLRPNARLYVIGYTDASGPDAVNLRLERRRARVVANRLRGLAGTPRKLTVHSIGSSALQGLAIQVPPRPTRARGAGARRVDIYLVHPTQIRNKPWNRFN